MGSVWCLRKPSWVGVQTKKSYPDFVGQFDTLVDTDVRWTPYTVVDIHDRAPQGLSSLCLRDKEYWMTRKQLVYDIHVEDYVVHRVMRQFHRYQESPVPVTNSVPSHVHRWTRQGQAPTTHWGQKVLPYVQQWGAALDDLVDEQRPHSNEAFTMYLQWYLPRTRTRVLHVPQEPQREPPKVSDTYPLARDQNFGIALEVLAAVEAEASYGMQNFMYMTPHDHESTYKRIKEHCKRFRRAVSGHSGMSSCGPRADDIEYTGHGGTDDDEEEDIGRMSTQWITSPFSNNRCHEEIGASQLGGVLVAPIQGSHEFCTTPAAVPADAARHPARQVGPPHPPTSSQRHTKAAQVAEQRARRAAQIAPRLRRGRI
ncbi:unnamed protein product [Urochloa humidicola]